MNSGDRKVLGRWGEEQVARDLRRRGCRIVAAGWHCRFGEIDLIVSDGTYLRFVEVKLRRNDRFATAREAVDWRKQEKLRASAQLYLSWNPTNLQPRFDVAEVYAPEGMETAQPQIVYWENAF